MTSPFLTGFADELQKISVDLKPPSALPPPAAERGLEQLQRKGIERYQAGFGRIAAKPVKTQRSLVVAKPPRVAG